MSGFCMTFNLSLPVKIHFHLIEDLIQTACFRQKFIMHMIFYILLIAGFMITMMKISRLLLILQQLSKLNIKVQTP